MPVTVKWWGQAAFWLSDGRTRVVTDPYTPELLGYAPIADEADLVIRSSHDDEAHCRSDLIGGAPAVIDALETALGTGRAEAKGVTVEAILAAEGENRPPGEVPGQNGMYRFDLGGIRFAHMGDVGNPLTAAQMEFFAGTDVLLALTGGELVIDLPDLMAMIERARPRLVIPMHFRTLTYRPRNSLWIESFLSLWDDGQVDFAFDYQTELDAAKLPRRTRVLVLDYAR